MLPGSSFARNCSDLFPAEPAPDEQEHQVLAIAQPAGRVEDRVQGMGNRHVAAVHHDELAVQSVFPPEGILRGPPVERPSSSGHGGRTVKRSPLSCLRRNRSAMKWSSAMIRWAFRRMARFRTFIPRTAMLLLRNGRGQPPGPD